MAAFTTNTEIHHAVRRGPRVSFAERFDAFFTRLGRSRAFTHEVERLSEMSDAQLATRGLARADIVRLATRAYL